MFIKSKRHVCSAGWKRNLHFIYEDKMSRRAGQVATGDIGEERNQVLLTGRERKTQLADRFVHEELTGEIAGARVS